VTNRDKVTTAPDDMVPGLNRLYDDYWEFVPREDPTTDEELKRGQVNVLSSRPILEWISIGRV
jgi:hypothetical protein